MHYKSDVQRVSSGGLFKVNTVLCVTTQTSPWFRISGFLLSKEVKLKQSTIYLISDTASPK